MSDFKWRDMYKAYVNLEYRKDRLSHMEQELSRVGLEMERMEGIRAVERDWDMDKYGVMVRRTIGACGCHESQCNIMREGLKRNLDTWVNEDDLVFATDTIERLDYIEEFLNKQESWDVVFCGGTVHVNPSWWHKEGHSSDLDMCECTLGRDAERTGDRRMLRTYGAFSTHSYFLNKNSIEKILKYFDENVHLSMGIDWLFIKMQPQLKAFMFVPGMVKQMDNQSDIGGGMTVFSGFSKLGLHWWQDKIEQFNPDIYDWGEAHKR